MLEVAPEIVVQVDASEDLCHSYVTVTPLNPSSSPTVAVKSCASVGVPLSDMVPTSLTLATVTVNDCVLDRESPSSTVKTTLLAPRSSSPGVPESVPVPSPLSVSDSQDGHVVQSSVMVFELGVPSSASVATTE